MIHGRSAHSNHSIEKNNNTHIHTEGTHLVDDAVAVAVRLVCTGIVKMDMSMSHTEQPSLLLLIIPFTQHHFFAALLLPSHHITTHHDTTRRLRTDHLLELLVREVLAQLVRHALQVAEGDAVGAVVVEERKHLSIPGGRRGGGGWDSGTQLS